MTYKDIIVEIREQKIGFIKLNRPQALNALSAHLIKELEHALNTLEKDPEVSVVILTGSERAFAAGADIKEMGTKTYMDAYLNNFITAGWERVASFRKPIIAAVAGYALGGGCEVAMMCDFIIAADNAKFALPEVNLGTIPGAGGTQRMTRLVGKSKAMDLCLTGRMMEAVEAERTGLASRVVPLDKLEEEAMDAARKMASMSLPVLMMMKEAVNRALEGSLADGLQFERRLFHATFALEDQKEGMGAFVEKRKPSFKNR